MQGNNYCLTTTFWKDLSTAKVISNDYWLQVELREYQSMIAHPYHKDRYSNFYYMQRAKYLQKRIKTAIEKGEIIFK